MTHKIYVTSQLTLRDTCQPSMSALLQECPPPVKGTSLSQRVKFGTPLNHVHPDVPRFWILVTQTFLSYVSSNGFSRKTCGYSKPKCNSASKESSSIALAVDNAS
ncbi:hypothetical protein JHK82_055358 [Glycine max]|nr:hypothetical protein JHK82_055358 [Glycine max]